MARIGVRTVLILTAGESRDGKTVIHESVQDSITKLQYSIKNQELEAPQLQPPAPMCDNCNHQELPGAGRL
jgi:hypothetical protein